MQDNSKILSNLKEQKKQLVTELNKVNKAIIALEPIPMQTMDWKKKALDCLKKRNQFSQTTEILDCLIADEILEDEVIRKRYVTGLSVALNDLWKEGLIKKFRVKRWKGDFYGFPSWFEDNGAAKKQFINPIFIFDENEQLVELICVGNGKRK